MLGSSSTMRTCAMAAVRILQRARPCRQGPPETRAWDKKPRPDFPLRVQQFVAHFSICAHLCPNGECDYILAASPARWAVVRGMGYADDMVQAVER